MRGELVLEAAIPVSVRDISCSTPASWLASVEQEPASSARSGSPTSSISSDPCCSSTDGSPEVSTPAIDVAPVSSNAAAAVAAISACAAWNWEWAWFSRSRTWPSLACAADSCCPAWSQLLADLVELAGELVDLGLDLTDGRLRRRAGAGSEDREPAGHDQPGHDRDTAADPGHAARQPRPHVPATLPKMSPLTERLPRSWPL